MIEDDVIHPVLQDPKAQSLLAAPFGRFSDTEFQRRRKALAGTMAQHNCDALLLCAEQRAGTAVVWLTGWPGTTDAMALFQPAERDVLFVEHYNHIPNARQLAPDAEIRWAQRQGAQAPIDELKRRGVKRLGIMGMLTWGKQRQLAAAFELADLNADYARLRTIKSDEEIEWMRIGAAFSDLGMDALRHGAKPGMTERELGAMVEREYHALGGATVIHFIGVNDMAAPDTCVPPQFPSSRKLKAGDMVFMEITASFWDLPGQVLRSFTIEADPTPLFKDLHDVAEAAFASVTKALRAGVSAREVAEASALIEQAGYSTYDDVVHGFGGGYWSPVLGSQSRPAGPIPDMTLEANMTIVVQPNVITRDEKAGVQYGEMLRITADGFERMHHAPFGFLRVG